MGNNGGTDEALHVAETSIEGHWEEYQRVYYLSRYSTYCRVLNVIKEKGKKRLLDVGSAAGWFMDMAVTCGYDVYGIEPSKEIAFKGAQYSGRPVQVALLENNTYSDGFFDVITMFDVLEHTQNPVKCLQQVRRLLAPQGLFVIRVPDINGLLPSISRWLLIFTGGRYFKPAFLLWRHHNWGFNRQSLLTLLKKMRFEILYCYSEDALELSTISLKWWANNKFIVLGVSFIIRLSHLLDLQDELVVISSKLPD